MAEQQDCFDQISLLQSKLIHLEQTMKLEEEENKLKDKMEMNRIYAVQEAELAAKKAEEMAKEDHILQEEEGVTRKLVKKMVDSNGSQSSVTNVLVRFEGF